MAVDIFTKLCTQVDIKFVHKYKVVLGWSLILRYSVLIYKNIRHKYFLYVFVYTVCTCCDIHLLCLKCLNGTSLFFN